MGLGLEQFLNHNKDGGGGGRKFLRNWKDDGSIVIWLSTLADPAYASWNHPFMYRDTYEDKDTGKEKEVLRFTRFVSPDPEVVHSSQYFREDDDRLRVPPHMDPFLLLREWLRLEADHIPLDATIFEWENPKNGEIIQWSRGRLARLVDKTKDTWNHTLDTKLEYLFVVIADDAPEDGPQIVRGTKLLGDKMKEAIGQEMESNGAEGNPLTNPYAFKWEFDKKARSPMDYYKAYRFNRAKLTEEIRKAITDPNYPDPEIDTKPRAGDKARIRAAMEDAAQVDLPWDRIFVDAWEDADDSTDFPHGANVPKADRTPEVKSNGKAKAKPAAAAAESEGTPRRRKKKADKPKPPPEPERIACDDCGHMMLPTDSVCEKCGAEYEVETADAEGAPAAEKCWACGGKVEGSKCRDCGVDVTDDLPYA